MVKPIRTPSKFQQKIENIERTQAAAARMTKATIKTFLKMNDHLSMDTSVHAYLKLSPDWMLAISKYWDHQFQDSV